MFILRPATEQDAPAIHSLIREARINPTGLDWRRFLLAVVAEGEVIGCGQLKPHSDGSLELASIAVSRDWRGKGVARAIIGHLLSGKKGDIYLMCRSELGSMYEKFGFSTVQEAEMPRYFRRISKMAGLIELLRREGSGLLVMKRPGEARQE
jgi:N-acetylglutamate synthase-like GNAT family acetyltransferase